MVAGRLATDWGREPALWLRDRLAHSRWTACRSATAPAHSPNNGGKENKSSQRVWGVVEGVVEAGRGEEFRQWACLQADLLGWQPSVSITLLDVALA